MRLRDALLGSARPQGDNLQQLVAINRHFTRKYSTSQLPKQK